MLAIRECSSICIPFTSENLHCPPAKYLTPVHQLKIMVAWWYTWRKVTWLSFFLRMKKICGRRGRALLRSVSALFHAPSTLALYILAATHRVAELDDLGEEEPPADSGHLNEKRKWPVIQYIKVWKIHCCSLVIIIFIIIDLVFSLSAITQKL